MSCRLIVAQMTSTRCELVNFLIYPLFLVVVVAILVPGLSMKTELTLLYGLTGILVTLFLCFLVLKVLYENITKYVINESSYTNLLATDSKKSQVLS
jgi:hypothetical protein